MKCQNIRIRGRYAHSKTKPVKKTSRLGNLRKKYIVNAQWSLFVQFRNTCRGSACGKCVFSEARKQKNSCKNNIVLKKRKKKSPSFQYYPSKTEKVVKPIVPKGLWRLV